jgi:hypothetical protein
MPVVPIYNPASLAKGIYVTRNISISSNFVYRGGAFFYSGGGPYLPYQRDPLLLPGAPATLIGWINSPSDPTSSITINGSSSAGLQEALVQAPLDVNLAGNVNVGSTFISSQLVDVEGQGNNIQSQFPGVYSMTTGSMTFEFTMPNSAALHADSATISEPSDLTSYAQRVGPSSGSLVDVSQLHAYLYNWQKGSWDSIQLTNFNYSTDNITPYIGSGGRLLLQFSNQDSSVGTIIFGKPTLQLQGRA